MKFRFAVEVEVKNDAASQETGNHDLAVMLMGLLENNKLDSVPWVIQQHYSLVKE
jgi:hypothetical protein